MHAFRCKECGQNYYSAAEIECLYEPNCSRCGGKLKELSEEEAKEVKSRWKAKRVKSCVRQKKD